MTQNESTEPSEALSAPLSPVELGDGFDYPEYAHDLNKLDTGTLEWRIPELDKIPSPFRTAHGVEGADFWVALADNWYYEGLLTYDIAPRAGIDSEAALEWVHGVLDGAGDTITHSIQAAAWLLSRWFYYTEDAVFLVGAEPIHIAGSMDSVVIDRPSAEGGRIRLITAMALPLDRVNAILDAAWPDNVKLARECMDLAWLSGDRQGYKSLSIGDESDIVNEWISKSIKMRQGE